MNQSLSPSAGPMLLPEIDIVHYQPNNRGRDFVVGDIHGCYDVLMDGLKQNGFDFRVDRIFAVGDLIDRGPDSFRVLKLLEEPWFFSCIGNHECYVLNAAYESFQGPYSDCLKRSGAEWLESLTEEQLTESLDLILKMPLAIELGDIGIVHAEPPDNWHDIAACRVDKSLIIESRDRLTERSPDQHGRIEGIALVVVGHTPLVKPLRRENVIYIDTKCFRTGKLTILPVEQIQSSLPA